MVVTCSGEEVARHRRSPCPHRTITAVDHARARREMRRRSVDEGPSTAEIDVEQRDLAVYDRALGIA